MMGRKGRSSGNIPDQQLSADRSVLRYIGRDGISLDGESVQLPGDPDYDGQDEVSSIGTSLYGESAVAAATYFRSVPKGNKGMHALGKKVLGQEEDNPPSGRGGRGAGCCPSWISEAQPWLKGVIVLSSVLLFSALVLVIVAAGIAKSEKSISATSSTDSSSLGLGSNFPPAAPVDIPTLPPVAPVSTPPLASGKPVVQTAVPSRMPTLSPFVSVAPTVSPSSSPSQSAVPTITPTRFKKAKGN
jgi:hypothetical protein